MCRRRNHRIENHRSKSLRTPGDAELHVMCFRMGNCMTVVKFCRRISAIWGGEPALCETIVSSSTAIIISDIFFCAGTTAVSRYSAYRDDTTSRSGLWRICLVFRISKKAARFRCTGRKRRILVPSNRFREFRQREWLLKEFHENVPVLPENSC